MFSHLSERERASMESKRHGVHPSQAQATSPFLAHDFGNHPLLMLTIFSQIAPLLTVSMFFM